MWIRSGYDTATSDADVIDEDNLSITRDVRKEDMVYKKNCDMQWSFDRVMENVDTQRWKHLDLRPSGRFTGTVAEARPGVRSGHIPNSKNVPFTDLLTTSKGDISVMRREEELRKCFEGVDVAKNDAVVFSCGSGLTACIGALAFDLVGSGKTAVYDGSWMEWGSNVDAPIEIGERKCVLDDDDDEGDCESNTGR